ncbi:MAG: single-strand binding protein [Thermoleophilia bacterium]|nr:single-strand binding protein [Thermoleophilia bacterium]
MNVVALVGNLATDPELRQTGNGRAVCTFRLAVSRPSGDQADFLTVVAWERQAEVCKEYLSVGRRVAVDGRLHHSVWDAEDGTKRSKVEVVAHRVELLGGGPRKEASTPAPDEDFAPAIDMPAEELALA